MEMDSEWGVDGMLVESGLIVSDCLEGLLLIIMVIMLIMLFICMDSILAIELVIIIMVLKLMGK
jgi:hypothetical protein